jgi:hypothetical protein
MIKNELTITDFSMPIIHLNPDLGVLNMEKFVVNQEKMRSDYSNLVITE